MHKNRILYLSINSSYSHSSLAYGQLRAYTEKISEKYKWNKIEATINDNQNDILNKILLFEPGIIVSTLYLYNHEFTIKLSNKLSLLRPDIKIILGGPEFMGDNHYFLNNNPQIYCVFRGDETSFPFFLNNIENKSQWSSVNGLCYINKNQEYIDNGISRFSDNLDNLPSLYDKFYFDNSKPFLHFETSRGCISRCSFCSSSLSNGIKLYSLERVASDLNILKEAGIKEIRILDRTFNVPLQRSLKLLELFFSSFSNMKFHIEIDPSKLTHEFISKLSEAKKNQLHIEAGVQTFNEATLKSTNRMVSNEAVINNLKKLCSLENIEIHTDLIAGLPEQTYLNIFDDISKLSAIGPEEIQLELVKILPGSLIGKNKDKGFKWSPQPPYEILETNSFSFSELSKITCLSKIIDSYYNVKVTRNVFRYAITYDNNFLKYFLEHNYSNFLRHDKPAPSKRFKLLFEYAEKTDNKLLYNITLFTYFMNGFFNSPKNNIELIKKKDLTVILKDNKINNLWNSNHKLIDKPVYLAKFDYNIGDLWLDPFATLKKGDFKYLFRLSCAGMSKQVSSVDLIE
ncbi:MAG TPA: DUF4080 domain-containing protein [Victivallales bacterium]|nr:DUF4080 domain-containing protein [Victivallales bacterium]